MTAKNKCECPPISGGEIISCEFLPVYEAKISEETEVRISLSDKPISKSKLFTVNKDGNYFEVLSWNKETNQPITELVCKSNSTPTETPNS